MKLIKISSDKVQIKTDSKELKELKINDLLLLSDKNASIVCVISSLTGNDAIDVCDYDGSYLGQTDGNSNIECGIIGSILGGKFTKSIDVYPTTGVEVSIINRETFSKMILDAHNSYFKLGCYANYDTEAMVDGNKFFQRHSAVIGNTGSGKSFAISSMLGKLAELKSSNVILFDLHGEYSGLSFAKTIKIGNNGMDFPLWFLSFRDIYSSLLKLKEESAIIQLTALRKAYYAARRSKKSEDLPIQFSLNDIIEYIKNANEDIIYTGELYKTGNKAGEAKTVKGENNGKLSSVLSLLNDKLEDERYSFMFSEKNQDYLYEFIDEVFGTGDKNIKIIDLTDVPHDMIPTVVAVITKLIYAVQLQQKRTEIKPINLICEEAHVYIPSSDFGLGASQRRLLEIFETIAKEGRKFGVTLTIVSQRPSELNKTIMAQVANFIVMKISNESDKSMIKGILPESSHSVIDMTSLFMPGDCFVIGDSAKITFKIKIDYPAEQPLSNTIDVWDVWSNENVIDTNTLVSNLLK